MMCHTMFSTFVAYFLLSFQTVYTMNYLQYGQGYFNARARRSLVQHSGSDICTTDVLNAEAKQKIQRHSFPLKNDNNFGVELVWLGDKAESLFLLTTTEIHFLFMAQHRPSKLYQSTDMGFTFDDIQERINNTEIRSQYGIMKSPIDSNKLIFISYEHSSSLGSLFGALFKHAKSLLVITEDAGKTFRVVDLPFKLREGEPLIFHPTNANWIMALEVATTTINMLSQQKTITGEAWISKDFGKTWTVMMKGHKADSVKWGAAKGKEGEEIYLSTEKASQSFSFFGSNVKSTLWRSDDGGKTFDEIVEHCYNFGVKGDFVFASVDFNDSTKGEARKMYVSKNSGKDFNPVNVPEISSETFYAVVEMFKDLIFLHVDEDGDTGQGTLYISDSDGLKYTKSLEKHFYTDTGFTDFYKFDSMPGVYITKVLADDKTLKAVITYDRGVTWGPIKVDPEYCKNVTGECTLHFHHAYSKTKSLTIPSPLSSENAPGIILMHGMVGDGLTGESDVWLSINGGYDWKKIANGPHLYAIGDKGNLIVVYPMVNQTGNKIKYSIDMGRCWNDYEFTDANDKIMVRGLVTEPHSNRRVFSVWGTLTTETDSTEKKEWAVFTINFHAMFTKQCDTTDLEEWYPHKENSQGGCLLGEKMTFLRPKLDATCYLGSDFNPVGKIEKCVCTVDDLECDYGYNRQPNGTCVKDDRVKPLEICQDGEIMEERFSKGYRRVPGNACNAKDSLDDIVKLVDGKKTCKPSPENGEGIIKLEKNERKRVKELQKKLVEEEQRLRTEHAKTQADEVAKEQAEKVKKKKSKHHGVAIFLSVVALIACVAVGIWYARRRKTIKIPYVMSNLDESQTEDERALDGLYDPRPKSARPYQDETDAEDETLLPL